MRDIKFRAWNKKLKCWGGGVSINRFGVAAPALQRKDVRNRGDTYHIMQYTGLLDKNGKPIYEGDIVKSSLGEPFEIIFDKGAFQLKADIRGLAPDHRDEVIGNIYENPELLNAS